MSTLIDSKNNYNPDQIKTISFNNYNSLMTEEFLNSPNYHLVAMIHGITGLIIFIAGVLQFILKKSGPLHRIIGRIYFLAWIVILISGAFIGSIIIVAIVVMGFYLCVTGIRAAVLKGKPIVMIDKIILMCAALIVLFMLAAAIYLTIKQHYSYAILASIFSLLYGYIVGRDILFYFFGKNLSKENYGKMGWYLNHLTRMQASFITAVSAFVAVQDLFGNMVVNFTLPGVISFFIMRRSKKYFIKKMNIKIIPNTNQNQTTTNSD